MNRADKNLLYTAIALICFIILMFILTYVFPYNKSTPTYTKVSDIHKEVAAACYNHMPEEYITLPQKDQPEIQVVYTITNPYEGRRNRSKVVFNCYILDNRPTSYYNSVFTVAYS